MQRVPSLGYFSLVSAVQGHLKKNLRPASVCLLGKMLDEKRCVYLLVSNIFMWIDGFILFELRFVLECVFP